MQRWMLEGQSLEAIREAIARLYPGTDAQKTLAAISRTLTEVARTPQEAIVGWALAATRDLYRRLIEVGDFVGALRAVSQLADLSRKAQRDRERTEPSIDL